MPSSGNNKLCPQIIGLESLALPTLRGHQRGSGRSWLLEDNFFPGPMANVECQGCLVGFDREPTKYARN
jgi:hypothetical protein